MASNFNDFIQELIDSDEVNVLLFQSALKEGDDDTEKSNARIYISVKSILKYIEKENIYYVGNVPILSVNLEDKPCLSLSTQTSSDLRKCYIYNDILGTSKGNLPNHTFKSFYQFDTGSFTDLNSLLKQISNVPNNKKTYIYPQAGNINNIYLDCSFLADIIKEGSTSNTDNIVSIQSFLQSMCDEMTRSLGGINDFQPHIDEEENELTIMDFNQGRLIGLTDATTTTNINLQGLGSFITNLSVESNITPETATMISVGAQANANVLGEEATTFSKLSLGLIDRIQPFKEFPTGSFRTAVQPSVDQLNNSIEDYISLINRQKHIGSSDNPDQPVPLNLSDDDFENTNISTDVNKYYIGFFTNNNVSNTTFIPIKLSMDMLGISGIKIFQKFKTDSILLPYEYRDNYEFIITEISHEIGNDNYWNTKIGALVKLKEKEPEENVQAIELKPISVPVTPGRDRVTNNTIVLGSIGAGALFLTYEECDTCDAKLPAINQSYKNGKKWVVTSQTLRQNRSTYHGGVDIAGANILGKILRFNYKTTLWARSSNGASGGYGNVIVLKGKDNNLYYFAHLNGFSEKIKNAKIGDDVTGIALASIGNTDDGSRKSTGPHLHFEVRNSSNKHVCPQPWLNYIDIED
jgi:hypothetical protein